MSGSLKAFGEIFPRFEHNLGYAGAIPERLTQDVRYERAEVDLWPMRDLGPSILFASRPVMEFTLRRFPPVLDWPPYSSRVRPRSFHSYCEDPTTRQIDSLRYGPATRPS